MGCCNARDVESALLFGDVRELIALDPQLPMLLFGATDPKKAAAAAAAVLKVAGKVNQATQSLIPTIKPIATANVKLAPKLTAALPAAKPLPAPAAKPAPAATKPPSSAAAAVLNVASAIKSAAAKPAAAKPAAAKPAAKPAPAATKPAATTSATNVFTTGKTVAPKPPTTLAELAASKPPIKAAAPALPATKPTATAIDYSKGVQTANFLEPAAGPLAASNVLPHFIPGLTVAPLSDADRAAIARQKVADAARATANANVAYTAQRKKELDEHNAYIERMRTEDSPEARAWRAREKDLATAKVEIAPFVRAAGVLATGAALITTAGAAAGAIGLTTGGASLATAAAADKLIAELEKGGVVGAEAKKVIDEAKKAASGGDAVAAVALDTINRVAKERIERAIPKGTAQTVASTAQAAFDRVQGLVDNNPGKTPSQLTRELGGKTVPIVFRADLQDQIDASAVMQRAARGLPRWFVSAAGGLASLRDTLTAPVGRGFVVYNTGTVVAQ